MEAKDINTTQDMQHFVEGCINDFENGLATKEETLTQLSNFSYRIINTVTSRKEKLETAVRLLSELQELQNGPPLEQQRTEWQQVMKEIDHFLLNYNEDQ